jgi:cytochrome oxidase assembly protein ShyY1
VLVNRGWVPLKGDLARPTGPVEVVGVVSEGEKVGDMRSFLCLYAATYNRWLDLMELPRGCT